jgi:hypothetical protein
MSVIQKINDIRNAANQFLFSMVMRLRAHLKS